MNDKVAELKAMVLTSIYHNPKNGEDELRKLTRDLAAIIAPELSEREFENLVHQLKMSLEIGAGQFSIVEGNEFKPWLDDAKSSIDPFYWERYREYLILEGMPNEVITRLDELTDKMLSRLGNPAQLGQWDRRGMVVGHVQSGKTSNYIGLMCKAADAGYRLIIVVAGIHNNLRDQTQSRIDLGFIGRDTGELMVGKSIRKRNIVGVGKINSNKTPASLTTKYKDFNKSIATAITSEINSFSVPVVLVIKKNSNSLSNLIDWLVINSSAGDTEMIDQPMILIDDEADNASINTRYSIQEFTRINSLIRNLLNVFHRSCYIGFTATPFANIFIDPDQDDDMFREDLFPRDFIIGLNTPSNYFGPSKIFDEEEIENNESTWLRFITDNEIFLPIGHRKDYQPNELPDSLVDALRTFLLTRVIRNLRGQKREHCSMLVNSSIYTDVQGKIRDLLHEKLEKIKNSVRINGSRDGKWREDTEINELYKIWEKEFKESSKSWNKILEKLFESIASAKIVVVNRTENGLDYKLSENQGQTVVAVGGYSLSRGLTLEGLTVTWFSRNSLMYDTLMQMGRWFGYRTGYEDICRIWMPMETANWYAFIARATEELHKELSKMDRAKLTPQKFGLAVRSHPATLHVTARNKMGAGKEVKTSVSLSNQFVETSIISAKKSDQVDNVKLARNFVAELKNSKIKSQNVSGGFLYSGVSVSIVDKFIAGWKNSARSLSTDPELIRQYIIPRIKNELKKWDILISSTNSGETNDTLGISIRLQERKVGIHDIGDGFLMFGAQRSRLGSRGIEKAGIEKSQIEEVERKFRKEKNIKDDKEVSYPDLIYREVRKRALFILHLVKVFPAEGQNQDAIEKLIPKDPVVGWGISLPESRQSSEPVEYIFNAQRIREWRGIDIIDENYEEEFSDE